MTVKETIHNSPKRYNFVSSIQLLLHNSCNIKMSKELIDDIIQDKMNSEYKNFSYEPISMYIETDPRDQIFNIISNHFLNKDWPKAGVSDEEFNKFLSKLKEKIEGFKNE